MEVAKWQRAFGTLGWETFSVAGEGSPDVVVAGLELDTTKGPDRDELENAFATADLVVVDNLCSLPLNALAGNAVASALRNRPAVLRHHDLPWQHARWSNRSWQVPDDDAWTHVALTELSRSQLDDRGIAATTMYNTFDDGRTDRRDGTRARLGVAADEIVFLHPTRAIERKDIPAALALAEALGATYWLTGPAEQGYDAILEGLIASSSARVIRESLDHIAHGYAACDAVVFPSRWEGFGNPPVEAALHDRIAAVGAYPVASELVERFGFRWLPTDDPKPLARWLADPDPADLDHNRRIAQEHFSTRLLPAQLSRLVSRWGW